MRAALKQGMHFLHRRGIIHRDLKSLNILLTDDEKTGERTAKISDFGLAKVNSEITNATGCGRGVYSKVSLFSAGRPIGQSGLPGIFENVFEFLCVPAVVSGHLSRCLVDWRVRYVGLTLG